MRNQSYDPVAAARNVVSKAWRRALVVPKRGVRLVRRVDRLCEQARVFQTEWQVEREIAAVARGRGPIIVGPWLSEVGFEVLYWIPFLRWFEDRYRVNPGRVIAVSRGGVAEWYGDVAARYVEIFDDLDPEAFRRRNAERQDAIESGGQKQTAPGSLDRDILSAAWHATGLECAAVCHPSLMYRLFSQYWFGNRALDLVTSRTRHLPFAVKRRSDLGLPAEYVAAKFYTGTALPDTPQNRESLRELVRGIAQRRTVVTLDTGMATDEHEDYLFHDIPNVMSLRDRLTPQSNLGLQTSVIAGAQQFVGTCGSMAWMAPMLGVDTTAIYTEERLLVSHVALASQVYARVGAARFHTLDLQSMLQTGCLASHATATGLQ